MRERNNYEPSTVIFASVLLCLVLGPSRGLAQSSGGSYKITSSVQASGGGTSTGSGNKVIEGTAAQSASGGPQTAASISHVSGFWPTTLAQPALPQNGQTTFQFSANNYSAPEDLGALSITITRNGDTSAAASVDYATVNGPATQKSDFEYAAGRVTVLDQQYCQLWRRRTVPRGQAHKRQRCLFPLYRISADRFSATPLAEGIVRRTAKVPAVHARPAAGWSGRDRQLARMGAKAEGQSAAVDRRVGKPAAVQSRLRRHVERCLCERSLR